MAMRVLFVGLGSIGQRHLQNLIKIQDKTFKEKPQIYALRRNFSRQNVVKNGQSFRVGSLDDYYGIKTLKSVDEAKKIKPDVVFVTNPSSLHIDTALDFAKIGSNLFIEKPVGGKIGKLPLLEKVVAEKKLIAMVGYQGRFNPLILRLQKLVKKNGRKIISANFSWNTFLPAHHSYEDYTKGYAARKDLGGGVVLGLIHELDLIYNFFGYPKKILATGGKLSRLKMKAEDTVAAILEYGDKSQRKFIVSLNLSYAQTKEERKFKIQFDDQTLFADLMENSYAIYDKNGILIEQKKDVTSRSEMFLKEITYFFECIKNGRKATPSINDGRKSLEMAIDIKKKIFK